MGGKMAAIMVGTALAADSSAHSDSHPIDEVTDGVKKYERLWE
jgi:hypothetical protein